jgi:hydroxymethylpyrimidine pyrophosphatase-like HAD family hydrolase
MAMGQAPDEVREVATDVTGTDREQGVASALARYFQG